MGTITPELLIITGLLLTVLGLLIMNIMLDYKICKMRQRIDTLKSRLWIKNNE